MYVAEWSPEQGWKGELRAYGPLQLDPSAQVDCLQWLAPCAHFSVVCGNADFHDMQALVVSPAELLAACHVSDHLCLAAPVRQASCQPFKSLQHANQLQG